MSLSAVAAKRCSCGHSESMHVWLPHRGRRDGCNVTGCGCRCFADAAKGSAPPPASSPTTIPPPPKSSPGRVQRCTSCGVQGHNARSCPERKPIVERDLKPANVSLERVAAKHAVPPPPPTIDPLPSLVHPDLLPDSDEVDRLIAQRAALIHRLGAERNTLKARLERVEEQLRRLTNPAT